MFLCVVYTVDESANHVIYIEFIEVIKRNNYCNVYLAYIFGNKEHKQKRISQVQCQVLLE